MDFPPTAAPPPWARVERPVARPVPPQVPSRPVARPQRPKPPKRRPQVPPEPVRRPALAERLSGGGPSAAEQAVRQLEGQSAADVQTQVGSLQETPSLAQVRAAQRGKAAPAVEASAFPKPTVAELRRAIVLNEILGPPLGLRERTEP